MAGDVQSILSAAEDDEGDFNPYAHSRTGDKRSSFVEATPDRPSKRRATDARKMVYNVEADEFMSLEEAQARSEYALLVNGFLTHTQSLCPQLQRTKRKGYCWH